MHLHPQPPSIIWCILPNLSNTLLCLENVHYKSARCSFFSLVFQRNSVVSTPTTENSLQISETSIRTVFHIQRTLGEGRVHPGQVTELAHRDPPYTSPFELCLWTEGGNRRTRKKNPRWQHSNFTLKGRPAMGSDPGPSCPRLRNVKFLRPWRNLASLLQH